MSSTDSESSTGPGAIPSELFVKTKLCKYFATTGCTLGQACRFAHGRGELRPVPPTLPPRPCDPRLCKGRGTCKFAHEDVAAEVEVPGLPAAAAASPGGRPSGVSRTFGWRDGKRKRGRQTVQSSDSEGGAKVSKQGEAPTGKSPPPYKIKLCSYHSERGCLKGEQCTFAHGPEELLQKFEAENKQRQLEADQAAAEVNDYAKKWSWLWQKLGEDEVEVQVRNTFLMFGQLEHKVNDYAKKWSWLWQKLGEDEVEVQVRNTFLNFGQLEHKARSHERSRSAGPL